MAQHGISYSGNPKSSWYEDDDDDIDDEMFLRNSRKPAQSSGQPLHGQVAQLTANRDAIEALTLASTERSLSMLRESEQVGVATAQELAAQREQLERTSRNLDSINATLRTTQRNIDGLKSVFSSFKNYLTGSKDPAAPRSIAPVPVQPTSTNPFEEAPPPYRLQTQETERKPTTAQEGIDRNLSYMSTNITNLRGLALNLGDEILTQNEMLDSMQYKAEKAEVTIGKQNVQMNRLLGKK